MSDLKISEIMAMGKKLQEKYKGVWTPLSPENGRNSLLWMMEEMGEVISIIKKRGEKDIMEDEIVREAFIAEMVDVMMFYIDTLMSFNITAEEFSEAYENKHNKNMNRDFIKEHKNYLKK